MKKNELKQIIREEIQKILNEDAVDDGMLHTFDSIVAEIKNYEKQYHSSWFLYKKKDDTKFLNDAIAETDRAIKSLEKLKKDVFKKQIIIHNERT